MAVLSWGKPSIYVKDLDAETPAWKLFPVPAKDTTTLETTKGEKTEAKLEGGENEDVRYERNTYVLNTTIRATKGREKPIEDTDGLINHNYAIALVPEDASCEGFYIPKTEVSLEDTWSAADGGQWAYAFDALKPNSGKQVQWGVVAATAASSGTYTLTLDGSSI